MVGRRPAISPSVVVDAVLLYKDRVLYTNHDDDDKSKYILPAHLLRKMLKVQ